MIVHLPHRCHQVLAVIPKMLGSAPAGGLPLLGFASALPSLESVSGGVCHCCPLSLPILSYYIANAGVHPGRPRQAELPYIWQQRHRRQWVRMAHYPSQVCLTFGEYGRGQRSMRLRSDDQPGFYFSLWDSAQLPHGAALLRPEDESTPIPFLPWEIVKNSHSIGLLKPCGNKTESLA